MTSRFACLVAGVIAPADGKALEICAELEQFVEEGSQLVAIEI